MLTHSLCILIRLCISIVSQPNPGARASVVYKCTKYCIEREGGGKPCVRMVRARGSRTRWEGGVGPRAWRCGALVWAGKNPPSLAASLTHARVSFIINSREVTEAEAEQPFILSLCLSVSYGNACTSCVAFQLPYSSLPYFQTAYSYILYSYRLRL